MTLSDLGTSVHMYLTKPKRSWIGLKVVVAQRGPANQK